MKKVVFVIFLLSLGKLNAQIIIPGTSDEDMLRYEALDEGSSLLTTPSVFYERDSISFLKVQSDRLRFLPVYTTSAYNSGYARSMNNGALWFGKGVTQGLSIGVQYESKFLDVTLAPVLYFSQNMSFGLVEGNNTTEYNYQYALGNENSLDWIQRYGGSPFLMAHPGQSEIALKLRNFGMAFTTQNYSSGPARFYPIIQSKNGKGFPRIQIDSRNPIKLNINDLYLGSIDVKAQYGYLWASQYADSTDRRFDRFLSGLNVEYKLPFIESLRLGLIKTAIKDMSRFEWYDVLSPVYRVDQDDFDDLPENDHYDQIASVYADWYLPTPKLRMYFVFSRNDFFYNFKQLLQETEHSSGRVLGVEKIFHVGVDRKIHFNLESTNIIRSDSYLHRPTPPYYVHSVVRQGYTHQGQLLGAGFGPGGAAQTLQLNFFKKERMIGASVERIRYNEDYFNAVLEVPYEFDKENLHDVEYTFSLNFRNSYNRLVLNTELAYSRRLSMYNELGNDANNIFIGVHLSWSSFVKTP